MAGAVLGSLADGAGVVRGWERAGRIREVVAAGQLFIPEVAPPSSKELESLGPGEGCAGPELGTSCAVELGELGVPDRSVDSRFLRGSSMGVVGQVRFDALCEIGRGMVCVSAGLADPRPVHALVGAFAQVRGVAYRPGQLCCFFGKQVRLVIARDS